MEHYVITEDIEAPPRVIKNLINTDTDDPPRVSTKSLIKVNGSPSNFHTTKDQAPPPRARVTPMPIQIKSLSNPSCITHKKKPNIHRCPTLLNTDRVANVLQQEQKQVNQHIPVTIPFLTDIANPPNQLKHKDIIKTLDAYE